MEKFYGLIMLELYIYNCTAPYFICIVSFDFLKKFFGRGLKKLAAEKFGIIDRSLEYLQLMGVWPCLAGFGAEKKS